MLPQVSATKEKIQYSIDDIDNGKICEKYLNERFAELKQDEKTMSSSFPGPVLSLGMRYLRTK